MGIRKLGTNPGQPHSEEVCGTKRNLELKKIHLPTKDASIPCHGRNQSAYWNRDQQTLEKRL